MKQEKATKVGCQACKSSKQIVKTQNFLMISGGVLSILAIYGTIRLVMDIISLF
jgi:hypothetical protein